MKGYCLWYFKDSNLILPKKLINRELPNFARPPPKKISPGGKILWLLLGVVLVTKRAAPAYVK